MTLRPAVAQSCNKLSKWAEPHLGREVLRLWIREVVALIDIDGHGLAKLVTLVELLGLAPDPRRLLLSRAGEHAALARS